MSTAENPSDRKTFFQKNAKDNGVEVENCIHGYIRDKITNRRVGMFVGVLLKGETKVRIGWCGMHWMDLRIGRPFDEALAKKIAFGRALRSKNKYVPETVLENSQRFLDRCVAFFKGKEVPTSLQGTKEEKTLTEETSLPA